MSEPAAPAAPGSAAAPAHAHIAPGLRELAVPVDRLRALKGNPHHADVPALVGSYRQFGQRRPAVGRPDDPKHPEKGGELTAGNHVLEVAAELGWTHVAVLWIDDDDATARAFALADNRTAQLGSDDPAALAELLMMVKIDDDELFAATAYDTADLARLLAPELASSERDRADERRRAQNATVESTWAVIVDCGEEAVQIELLERLAAEGYECRALIS
jgi:ParB-like chromosome segregation protein Spo0J